MILTKMPSESTIGWGGLGGSLAFVWVTCFVVVVTVLTTLISSFSFV